MGSEKGPNRLAEIFVHERDLFLRYVRKQLYKLPAADAEDILSEVIYSLLSRGNVVEQVENISAYIYRSLRNRIVDRHRAAAPMVEIDDDERLEEARHELADQRLRPDQHLQQNELRRRIHEAIGRLSPRERAVWIATEIEGHSFRELSKEWNEPIGTLLSLKSRATARLRSFLADYWNHPSKESP